NDSYEPWYFKVHGESSSESASAINDLGGNKAVRVKLGGDNYGAYADDVLENKLDTLPAPDSKTLSPERKSRNQIVQPVTNGQLLQAGHEMLPYFKVRYIDHNGVEQPYDRTSHKAHHTAGFTALTQEGLRYNYGIPAYNLHQEEVNYTAKKQQGQ